LVRFGFGTQKDRGGLEVPGIQHLLHSSLLQECKIVLLEELPAAPFLVVASNLSFVGARNRRCRYSAPHIFWRK
jgi:hypothetical protein